MIPPCLTHSNTRYESRLKWSNPGKGLAPSHTCSSYCKGSLRVVLVYGRQLYIYFTFSYLRICWSLSIFSLSPTPLYFFRDAYYYCCLVYLRGYIATYLPLTFSNQWFISVWTEWYMSILNSSSYRSECTSP